VTAFVASLGTMQRMWREKASRTVLLTQMFVVTPEDFRYGLGQVLTVEEIGAALVALPRALAPAACRAGLP